MNNTPYLLLVLLAQLLTLLQPAHGFIRLWNRCPEGSSTRRWDLFRQRCTPDCPAFYVYNTWFRRCERGGIDSCLQTEYWDLSRGKCIIDQCRQGQGIRWFRRANYFDQRTRTCRQVPHCPYDQYFEDETGQCRRCGGFESVDSSGLYCKDDDRCPGKAGTQSSSSQC